MSCKGRRFYVSRSRYATDQSCRYGSAIVQSSSPSRESLTNHTRRSESSTSIPGLLDKCTKWMCRLRSASMANRLSLRVPWRIYKRTGILTGTGGKRDLAITQLAFYSGARGVLRVLAHLIEQGEHEELHETIRRHGRLLDRIQRRRPGARRQRQASHSFPPPIGGLPTGLLT